MIKRFRTIWEWKLGHINKILIIKLHSSVRQLSYLFLIWVGKIFMSNYCEILCTLWWDVGKDTMELKTMDAKGMCSPFLGTRY